MTPTMIELIDLDSPKAVGLRLAGKMEEADMARPVKAIEEKLASSEQVAIYVEVESFTGVSFDALVEDIRFALPNFKKFNKKAVVSDKQWMEKLTRVADKFLPSIELRHFSSDQREEARAWVKQ